jgi:hypothetical protein
MLPLPLTIFYNTPTTRRRKTRPIFGTISLPRYRVLQVMQYRSSRRKVYWVIPKEGLQHGKWQVCYKRSQLASSLPIVTTSMCTVSLPHALELNSLFHSNVDSHFQNRRLLMFPSKSIHTDGIRAGVMVCSLPMLTKILANEIISHLSASDKLAGLPSCFILDTFSERWNPHTMTNIRRGIVFGHCNLTKP